MQNLEALREKVNHMEQDLVSVKKIIITMNVRNEQRTEAAWKDFLDASKIISKSWNGTSAVEEIRKQREK